MRVLVIVKHPAPYMTPTFTALETLTDYSISYCYLQDNPAEQIHLREVLQKPRIHSHIIEKQNGIFGTTLSAARLLYSIVSKRFDCVIISGWASLMCIMAAVSTKVAGVRLIILSDTTMPSRARGLQSLFGTWMRRLVSHRIAGLWVPGKAARTYWRAIERATVPIAEGCYTLETNEPVCRRRLSALDRATKLRRRLGWEHRFVFVYIGRLIGQRGLTHLFDAFRQVAERRHDVALLVIGDGDLRSLVNGAISIHAEQVSWLRTVRYSNLPAIFALADTYVQPSTFEPYSLATLEAAMRGVPIVATAVVGALADIPIREAVIEVEPGSADALRAGMLAACENAPSLKAFAQRNVKPLRMRNHQWAAENLRSLLG